MKRQHSLAFRLLVVLTLTALLLYSPKTSPIPDAVPTVEAIDTEFCNALHPVCVSVGQIFYDTCRAGGGWWWTCNNEASLRTAECMRAADCYIHD